MSTLENETPDLLTDDQVAAMRQSLLARGLAHKNSEDAFAFGPRGTTLYIALTIALLEKASLSAAQIAQVMDVYPEALAEFATEPQNQAMVELWALALK